MTLEQSLSEHLKNAATTAGTRIRPEFLNENEQYPAVVYSIVSEIQEFSQDGPENLTEKRVAIDCYGKNYVQTVTLADEIITILQGFTGALGTSSPATVVRMSQLEGNIDQSEIDGDRHNRRRSLSFVITYEG